MSWIRDCGLHGHTDARLRLIFDNGTESNVLMRSLQRALHKDEAGRRITDSSAGPLFADHTAEGDEASGTIYVLRSTSDLLLVKQNRNVLHKIGVFRQSLNGRVAHSILQRLARSFGPFESTPIQKLLIDGIEFFAID